MADGPDTPHPAGGPAGDNLPVAEVLRSQPPVQAPGVDAGFVPAPQNPPTPLIAGWQVQPPQPRFSPPVLGALAVIFGVTAFYKATLLLGPLAIVVGLVACLRKLWGWGLIGILSAIAALAVNPYFWGLAGIYYIARLLGLVG